MIFSPLPQGRGSSSSPLPWGRGAGGEGEEPAESDAFRQRDKAFPPHPNPLPQGRGSKTLQVRIPDASGSLLFTMIPDPDETIVALSSANNALGPRAIVRISGPNTQSILKTLYQCNESDFAVTQRYTTGTIRLTNVSTPLPVECYFNIAPHSYTGQDLAELHTLGSPPLVEQLIAELIHVGARAAQPGEFTLRAFLAGKKNLPQAEAVLSVIHAGNDTDLRQALTQLAGGMTRPLEQLRSDLLNLLADVEAGLDFVDEDIEFVSKESLLIQVSSGMAHLINARKQLERRGISGRAIRVALVGEPNAGKSSLFNALLERPDAIVSDQEGTTRDYLAGTLALEDTSVQLIDTAGWQTTFADIDSQAQELGQQQQNQADIVLWCVPINTTPTRKPESAAKVLLVRTKSDLLVSHAETIDGVPCNVVLNAGLTALRTRLRELVQELVRPSLAPSQSRSRGHIDAAIAALRRAHEHVLEDDPQELLALALRETLDQLGEMVGAVYTNDLLDRIFSRFCIGK